MLTLAKGKRERIRKVEFLADLDKYQTQPSIDLLEQLMHRMQKSSTLQKEYGNFLLQEELYAGNAKLAKNLMKRIEKNAYANDPYSSYTQTTLSIARKEYDHALNESLQLLGSLTNKEPALKSLVELRIAMLYQKLTKKEEELAQINHLLSSKDSLSILEKMYFHDSLTIKDYLENRKQVLLES